MAARSNLIKSRLRRKLAEKRSSFADEFEYRLLCEFNHGFHKSPTMWEVERVAISMSNNAEEAIHQRVRDGAISQADATKFLASDTVQLHAKRWRRVTRQSKPLSEMTVEEALLDVEEMSNSRIWPDPCTLSMRCSLFSRWRPDKSSSFAATANGDVCVSVVDCPPAAERSDNAMNRVPAAEGDSEEYFLIDTHDFALDIQQDVEGRVIQTLKDKQQEALVINGTQTMGAWIHANETTVQFNLTSLMVCVPQADLMRWKQPRQTLQSVVAQRQAQYKEAVRAHLLAGGMLRPRRSLNGEKVVEAVFQLDNGLELCADFKRPGVFDETLPQRSTWSTLEDVPSTLKGLPKTAKVFKAPAHTPQSASRGRPLARKCSCPRCVAQQSSSQEAQEPTESSAAESPEAEAGASDATAKEDTPQNSKDTPPTKAKSSKRAAKQAQNTQQVQSTPDSAAPASPVAAADSAAHSAALPPAAEVSPLAAAFGSSLEDAVHRAGRSKGASGGLRMSSAYAASLGLDIDAGDSVRIGEERGGGLPALPPPGSPAPLQEAHSRGSASSTSGAASGGTPSAGHYSATHSDGLSLDGPVANLSVPSALAQDHQTGSTGVQGFSTGLSSSDNALGGSGFSGFGLGSHPFDSLPGFGGEPPQTFHASLAPSE